MYLNHVRNTRTGSFNGSNQPFSTTRNIKREISQIGDLNG